VDTAVLQEIKETPTQKSPFWAHIVDVCIWYLEFLKAQTVMDIQRLGGIYG
jgi:hypothetical protein